MSNEISFGSGKRWRAARKHRLKKITILILVLTAMNTTAGTQVPAQQPKHSQAKAAFLVNFVKFVEWPAEVFADNSAPIIVGVVGESPSRSAIEQEINGKTAHGRRLGIKRFPSFRSITYCHILFVSSSQDDNLSQILAAAGPTVLTVGETEQFAQMGGIITFSVVDSKLRFEINHTAAKQRGLRISAKLLSLARGVR